jgi:uncharacterized protein
MPTGAFTEFTPLASFLGGGLIGLSAIMVMWLFGRIAGISGITSGAIGATRDWPWQLPFILGLVAAPLLFLALGVEIEQTVPSNAGAMALGGLLTGFGTVWGSGCTSGHGVCGLARLSLRSLVAVVTFMAAAIFTVFFLRHVIG